jgi:hypothetical protein
LKVTYFIIKTFLSINGDVLFHSHGLDSEWHCTTVSSMLFDLFYSDIPLTRWKILIDYMGLSSYSVQPLHTAVR